MNKLLGIIIGCLTSLCSFAFFCPTNFNQISLGDTLEQVETQCGKPDKKESAEAEANVPQEWSYYNEVQDSATIRTMSQPTGTMKTSVTFDKDGKVISINSNGVGVGATKVCGGNIAIGDTRAAVKAACGEPMFIAKDTSKTPAATDKKEMITTLTYNSNPPTKLIFEGGVLARQE